MHLLISSLDYGPRSHASGIATWRIAEAIGEAGVPVTAAYDSSFSVPRGSPNVSLVPCSTFPSRFGVLGRCLSRQFLGFDLGHWSWCRRVVRQCSRKKFDIIWARSSPLGSLIAGALLQKVSHRPLVLHFADPFPAPVEWQPNPRERRRLLRTVKSLCAHATGFTFLCRQLQDYQERMVGMDLKPGSHIVPHLLLPWNRLGPRLNTAGPVFVHLGSFYGNRRPEALLAAFRIFRQQCPTAELHFVGESAHRQLAHLLPAFGLDGHVRLLGHCYEPLALLRNADVLVSVDGSDAEPVFLPSKLADYLSTDRVILAITPKGSPTVDLLNKIPQSAVVVGHRPEEIASGMKRAVELVIHSDGWNERQTQMAHLTAEHMVPSLINFLEKLFTPQI